MKYIYSLFLALTLSTSVSAVPIDVSGTVYNIEWALGSFTEIEALHGLTDEDWFGNHSLAGELVAGLGVVFDGRSLLGPQFVMDIGTSITGSLVLFDSQSGPFISTTTAGFDEERFYAYTTQVPEPGSLALLALGLAGLGAARKVRR